MTTAGRRACQECSAWCVASWQFCSRCGAANPVYGPEGVAEIPFGPDATDRKVALRILGGLMRRAS